MVISTEVPLTGTQMFLHSVKSSHEVVGMLIYVCTYLLSNTHVLFCRWILFVKFGSGATFRVSTEL